MPPREAVVLLLWRISMLEEGLSLLPLIIQGAGKLLGLGSSRGGYPDLQLLWIAVHLSTWLALISQCKIVTVRVQTPVKVVAIDSSPLTKEGICYVSEVFSFKVGSDHTEKISCFDLENLPAGLVLVKSVSVSSVGLEGIPEYLKEFEDVFSESEAEVLPLHRPFDCAIELVPGAKLLKARLFNLPGPEHLNTPPLPGSCDMSDSLFLPPDNMGRSLDISGPSSVQEAESDEELSEGGEMGGEMQVEEEPSAAAAAAEGSPRQSQSRRTRRRGHPSASQRAPAEEDDDDDDIDIDCLIDEVREREPLWNMADRRHADTGVTRRLWDEVCRNLFPRRESLHPQQQSKLVGKVRKRWRSLRDRFKREFNDEMKAPSGSAGRKRSKYKYGQALSFLRRTMLSRVTFSSHRAPASSSAPSGAIPPESATEGHVGRPHTSVPSSDPSVPSSDPSVLSTSSAPSSGALLQASLLASDAEQLAFPLPHPSDPATSTPPLGSWRQRQRGQERSYAPEFLHLNASFQGSFKILGEQVTAGNQQSLG
ncbi:uncharacterized protein LOC143767585 [Ranitomeya variabilis]|uniref:uncharacterized protein LOC143767585 n=1 Tax=Ranitomeya variabilis TaxID=490064 RepID=UPI004057205A